MKETEAINTKFLKFLRTFGLIEGTSTLILFFVAMPLKYMYDFPAAVTIFGSIHGLLFLGLCGAFFVAMEKVPLSIMWVFIGIFAAIIPFGPFLVDIKLKRLERNASL